MSNSLYNTLNQRRQFGDPKDRMIYKSIGMNDFEKKPSRVPDKANKKRATEKQISLFYDPSLKLLSNDRKFHSTYGKSGLKSKPYFTQYDGGVPFAVFVEKGQIYVFTIFTREDGFYTRNGDWGETIQSNLGFYQKLVFSAPSSKKVWIGGDPATNGFGGAILVQVRSHSYIFIANTIFGFTYSGQITDFYADWGNNVFYCTAISKKHVFFLTERTVDLRTNYLVINWRDMYGMYYGFTEGKISKDTERLVSNYTPIYDWA